MLTGLIIGFFAGIISTVFVLRFLNVVRISIVRQNKRVEKQKLSKSPYSDINLMDTKMDPRFRNCG
jgi:predicted small secreted protein